MNRMRIALIMLALLAGCNGKSSDGPKETTFDPDTSRKAAEHLRVAGSPGPVLGGLRAQLLLSADQGVETDTLRGTVLVTNTTQQEQEIDIVGAGPSFLLGAVRMAATPIPGALYNTKVKVPPGATLAAGPYEMEIAGFAGKYELSARVQAGPHTLIAPGVPFTIATAKWGPVVEGARLRVDAGGTQFAVGQPIVLHGVIQNMSDQPLPLRPVLNFDYDSELRRDLVTLHFVNDEEARVTIPPHGLFRFGTGKPLLLAPGKYRLRAVVSGEELGINDKPAWFGELISNDVAIEVK